MKLFSIVLNILFPCACMGCGAVTIGDSTSLCGPCRQQFRTPTAFVCPVCRGRIPIGLRLPSRSRLCHRDADYTLLALARYDQPAAQALVRNLKFGRKFEIADVLGEYAAAALRATNSAIDCIIPIPLSSVRLRERGFNQAELIARKIAALNAVGMHADVLLRTRNTARQTDLKTWQERARNLEGSFAVPVSDMVRGKIVLLVDDVWTSGATMGVAARALRKAGARRVIGLVIARA